MDQKRLIDVSPNPILNTGIGILTKLQSKDVPWKNLNIAMTLDVYYYGNHSGHKIISPLLDNFTVNSNTISDGQQTMLSNILFDMFNTKWDKLWTVQEIEYNPAENYDMTETGNSETAYAHGETITRTDNTTKNTSATRTDNLNHTKSGTETETPNITETTTPNITETNTPNLTHTVESDIYGFNSQNAQPANSGTERDTGTNTIQRTGTDTLTRTGTQQKTYNLSDTDTGTQGTISEERDTGTQTHAHTGTDTETSEHELRRHGNIGVTTSQQMLHSEIELWQWNFFNDVLFPDLDSVLTIQVY